jgi:hypothetical protein
LIEYATETFFKQQGQVSAEWIANVGFETEVIEARNTDGSVQRNEFSELLTSTNAARSVFRLFDDTPQPPLSRRPLR